MFLFTRQIIVEKINISLITNSGPILYIFLINLYTAYKYLIYKQII